MKKSITVLTPVRRKRRFKPIGVVLAAVALTAMAAAPAMAATGPNLVVNGNFASPHAPAGGSYYGTAVPGWDGWVSSNDRRLEIVGADVFVPPAGSAAGTQSVELNPNGNGVVEQFVPTVAGKTYTLNFDFAGNPNGGAATTPSKSGWVTVGTAYAGSLDFNTTGLSGADMGWKHRTFTFIAASNSSVIQLLSSTAGDYGPVVTNMSLVETPDAGSPMANLQIGGATALGLLALIGVGVVLRRRGTATAL